MRHIRHVSLSIVHCVFCIAFALAAVLPAAQPGTATLTVSGYKGTSTLTDFPVQALIARRLFRLLVGEQLRPRQNPRRRQGLRLFEQQVERLVRHRRHGVVPLQLLRHGRRDGDAHGRRRRGRPQHQRLDIRRLHRRNLRRRGDRPRLRERRPEGGGRRLPAPRSATRVFCCRGWWTARPTSTARRASPTASASPSPPAPCATSAATSARNGPRTAQRSSCGSKAMR